MGKTNVEIKGIKSEPEHLLLVPHQEGIAGKGRFRSVRGCRVRRLSREANGDWMLYGNPGNLESFV